jgi:hypothetical protein
MKQSVILILLILPAFISCEKKNEIPDDCVPINYISLTAENDTIELGGETRINAEATGDGLVYKWTKTLGVILGSGSSVTYVTTPCAIGEIEVTCKVTDRCRKSETMSVSIIVL